MPALHSSSDAYTHDAPARFAHSLISPQMLSSVQMLLETEAEMETETGAKTHKHMTSSSTGNSWAHLKFHTH